MLKLFRDYVFHAVTDEGRPFLDMAHVVQCLNKLDAGSSDKVWFWSVGDDGGRWLERAVAVLIGSVVK